MDTANNHDKLIDEIILLASLASNRRVIDPILNDVRLITAHIQAGDALSADDQNRLSKVRQRLEDYLVDKDELRTFTRKSIQERIHDQFANGESGHLTPVGLAKRQLKVNLGVVAGVFAVSAAVLLAFSVSQWWLFAASCSVTAMFLSTCWLFLSGYKTFTTSLRQAYAWICAGVVMLGLAAALWLIFTSLLPVYQVPVLRYGANYSLFGLAFIVAYVGLRVFAQTLKVKTRLTSLPVIVPSALLFCAVLAALPHVHTANDQYLPTTMVGVGLISFFGLVIAILARQVSVVVTDMYARALRWFGYGYGLSASIGAVCTVMLLLTGTGFGPKLVVIGMLYAMGGTLVFVSGYLFRLSSAGAAQAR